LTQVHFPTLPHPDFAGRTGAGDFADSLVEMDYHVGELLDELHDLGIENETIVIFASDNGPEFRRPWRGTAGPWRGTYHTAMEGGLRAPCIARWPGQIPAGWESNEIVHVVDLYATLARVAGLSVPTDRAIDGIDQLDFFTGEKSASNREGFLFYIKTELRAAKWRNWKMHVVWEEEPNSGPNHLETPWIFNLVRDPKEETEAGIDEGWVRTPFRRMIHEFTEDLKANQPIPPGAPDAYDPAMHKKMSG
jgi:arylsulfatase A-like enzyme